VKPADPLTTPAHRCFVRIRHFDERKARTQQRRELRLLPKLIDEALA
jgi:hypothetical protein